MFKARHSDTIEFIRDLYPGRNKISLHEPVFAGNEKKYVVDCIDSTFVSSVGAYVDRFERQVADYVGARYGVACMNGTAALHVALMISGVDKNSEVLSQALTFVATANAISYCRATPVFIDSDPVHMGMSTQALSEFLETQTEVRADGTYNKSSGRKIQACVPMHVFGHPVDVAAIAALCEKYKIILIEDAAESLGSSFGPRHTGTFGAVGTLSFNGNKTVTTGGGGMIVTNDEHLARRAKHLTTTAKRPHAWEFFHDEVGYNYRLPNLNAALGCAQMEQLESFLANKRETARLYQNFFAKREMRFVLEREGTKANYWLNTVILENAEAREGFLRELNDAGILARPIWQLMPELPAFRGCQSDTLRTARDLASRAVNLPSGVRK